MLMRGEGRCPAAASPAPSLQQPRIVSLGCYKKHNGPGLFVGSVTF